MGKPRRNLLATAEETSTPPAALSERQSICRIVKGEGNNLYTIQLPVGKTALAELPAKFRSTIWIKRGSFVVVNLNAFAARENKIQGEIDNVVRDEKRWRRQSYWPVEFTKTTHHSESDEDEATSRVGQMPPSDPSDSEG